MSECDWWLDAVATWTLIGTVLAVILLLSIAAQLGQFLWWLSKRWRQDNE